MRVGHRVVGMSRALSGTALPSSNAKVELFSAYDSFLSLVETNDGEHLVGEVLVVE